MWQNHECWWRLPAFSASVRFVKVNLPVAAFISCCLLQLCPVELVLDFLGLHVHSRSWSSTCVGILCLLSRIQQMDLLTEHKSVVVATLHSYTLCVNVCKVVAERPKLLLLHDEVVFSDITKRQFLFLDFSLISPSAPFGNNPGRDLPGLYCRTDLFKPLVKVADVMVILNLRLLSLSSPHLHLSWNINSRTEDKASSCSAPKCLFPSEVFFF